MLVLLLFPAFSLLHLLIAVSCNQVLAWHTNYSQSPVCFDRHEHSYRTSRSFRGIRRVLSATIFWEWKRDTEKKINLETKKKDTFGAKIKEITYSFIDSDCCGYFDPNFVLFSGISRYSLG
ncbi:Protein of unknown function [Cotesia congregata]|uniref:Secreted protein n=1 Tax=Cotesia congregata TaxID=51543 RepID=A0A8J2H5G3_COTCN|nr:Protein of unknown function [Cotesia congregata]